MNRIKAVLEEKDETLMEIFLKTIEAYHPCFIALQSKMQELKTKEESL